MNGSKVEEDGDGFLSLGHLEKDKVVVEKESENGRSMRKKNKVEIETASQGTSREAVTALTTPKQHRRKYGRVKVKVFEMELRSGQKRLRSPVTQQKLGRKSKESYPDYNNEEGGNTLEPLRDNKVSISSSEQLKRNLRSKKRHDACCAEQQAVEEGRGKQVTRHGKGVEVKGNGKVEEVQKVSTVDKEEDEGPKQAVGAVDVVIRHSSALKAVCALRDQLSDIQKEAIRGIVWTPVLEYEAFREVPFSYFDEAFVTGLPPTGKCVEFKRSEGTSEVKEVLKEVIGELETVGLFRKLYTLFIVIYLFFPQCAGGVAWDLIFVVEDMDRVVKYNWSEAVWKILVEAIEETTVKMQTTKNLQINGFAMILQGVINIEKCLRRARDAL
ncbi:LOW QUALITY PROTEIN: hypothetical protein Cgig2_000623 [Carnegiea gigantea]|uniref:Aminotransferase-like plant mobile domain-containing protein n=1 Tax=Carnegiea gigantea TaxID=171969 RepID=A0A9Q1KE25_9CARY|nr:LOW QUALITY PROTEIN: hypothetical protein Cgig2_000623 [Carnegiea gigantea]